MNISNKKELEETIIELEKRKAIQYGMMLQQYHDTAESLRPSNLIKGVFSDIAHSTEARSGILKTAAGLGIGFLTRKFLWGKSSSIVKKILGGAIKAGVTKTAIGNMGKIKAYGTAIYHNLFQKKTNADDRQDD